MLPKDIYVFIPKSMGLLSRVAKGFLELGVMVHALGNRVRGMASSRPAWATQLDSVPEQGKGVL